MARRVLVEIDGRDVDGDAPILALLTDPLWYLLVACIGDEVVGGLWGCALRRAHRPEPEFMLYEMGVREDRRNRGVGGALVQAFEEEARKAGAHEVWVLTNESNAPAVAMYARAGMTRTNPDDLMLTVKINAGED